ncbi:MAG: hypothetical protein ACYTHM_02040 [Planctomycetota bacterium]|jgi:hypothetical protein
MAKRKLRKIKKKKKPPSLRRVILIKGITFLGNIKRELAVLGLLLLALAVTLMVIFASQADPGKPTLEFDRVPLTTEEVFAWAETGRAFAQYREQGRLRNVRVSTLSAFLEWGRTNPELLTPALAEADPTHFLGVSLSLHNARRRLRELVEYDIRLADEEKTIAALKGSDIVIPYSAPPVLEDWERADLQVYEENQGLVEDVLWGMMPDIPAPIPAWEEEAPPPEEGAPTVKPVRIKWRVINRSRYGPKVIRVK